MEEFKIELFKKNYPTEEFPRFKILSFEEAREVFSKLSEKMGDFLPSDQVAKKINAEGVWLQSYNAEDDGFTLKTVFDKIKITPKAKVYLNWHHFDNVDEIGFDDLNQYFDDIWYPSSDDIDIFDESFTWILSISHYGAVSIVKL